MRKSFPLKKGAVLTRSWRRSRDGQRGKNNLLKDISRYEEEIKAVEEQMCAEEISAIMNRWPLGRQLEELKAGYEEAFEKLILME
ncbi:MAG: hypothetical protein ACLTK0_02515 [Anaerovoracaceae bacterium]